MSIISHFYSHTPFFCGSILFPQINIIMNKLTALILSIKDCQESREIQTVFTVKLSPVSVKALGWMWAEHITLNTTGFNLLPLTAVVLSRNTNAPLPLAAVHAHAATLLASSRFTDEVISWVFFILVHVDFLSSVQTMMFQNCSDIFFVQLQYGLNFFETYWWFTSGFLSIHLRSSSVCNIVFKLHYFVVRN